QGERKGREPRRGLPLCLALPLDCLLELASRRELGDAGRGDLDALAGARIHTLTRGTIGRGELAETREVDLAAALERVGDRVEEGVDRLLGVPVRQATPLRHRGDELLLGHESSYLDCLGLASLPAPDDPLLLPDASMRLNHALSGVDLR